jgi:uncharacterized membrane protein
MSALSLINVELFLISLILIMFLDYIFLGVVAKKFYVKELGILARKEHHEFRPRKGAAFVVYLVLAAGTIALILPSLATKTLFMSFVSGAMFGFVVYSVYDMTNYAILSRWSFKLSLIDIAFGTLLCGFVSFILKLLSGFII